MNLRRFTFRSIAIAAALSSVLQVGSPLAAHAAIGSTLTLSASPHSAQLGDQIDLSGTLAFDDASPSGGQTITLTREDASGSHPLPDATTDSNGTYSSTDTVDVGGQVTYHASFVGDSTYGPAEASGSVSVAKLRSHVSLAVSAPVVRFGTRVHLTAHLARGTESRELAIYAKPDGAHEKLVRKARVNRHRDLRATVTPSKDTTFIARYDGDLTHRAAHDDAVTRVRVMVHAKLTKAVARSGRYRIYRRGAHAPCIVRVLPNHKGFAVRAVLQMFTNGGWHRSAARSFRLNASSVAGFAIRGSSNVNFRVRVSLPTHHDHLGDTSPWQYLRFR
jgi:hypothetical protein